VRWSAPGRSIRALPLLRFVSLQRLQVVLRHPRRPADGPSRFDVHVRLAARRRSVPRRGGSSSLRFYRLVCFVRPAHAARLIPRFTPARCGSLRHGLSFARRSATRFTRPFHDWAGPVGALARSGSAHGISHALRSVPWRRVPAFLRFIPTCRFALRRRTRTR